jgi:hypothetical protein
MYRAPRPLAKKSIGHISISAFTRTDPSLSRERRLSPPTEHCAIVENRTPSAQIGCRYEISLAASLGDPRSDLLVLAMSKSESTLRSFFPVFG